ncbi:YrhB domain-containing protein [Streptomyces sp. NPDC015680]|uniref:YrhB domain-containing protein n=1 Tax=Streptomyces sp. NPDC015680 TaxID=3364962 RepID=UPI00370123A2
MIERDDAVRIVEEELARSHQAWVAAGVEQFPRSVVVHVVVHELVWKVYVQSEEYARTRNVAAMLVGHGPYLVDRVNGGLHSIGAVSEIQGAWEDDYRSRIRGLPVRTPVDDLHDELRTVAEATGSRIAAVRALRRKVTGLSPTHALPDACPRLRNRAARGRSADPAPGHRSPGACETARPCARRTYLRR